jgi:hypothetical protein
LVKSAAKYSKYLFLFGLSISAQVSSLFQSKSAHSAQQASSAHAPNKFTSSLHEDSTKVFRFLFMTVPIAQNTFAVFFLGTAARTETRTSSATTSGRYACALVASTARN